MLFLHHVNRLSLIKTNATKVALVFIYSLGALGLFAWNDAIDWKIGMILALGSSFWCVVVKSMVRRAGGGRNQNCHGRNGHRNVNQTLAVLVVHVFNNFKTIAP